jgi:hypothetical protein
LVIEHGRRRILYFNVTQNPSADWVQQLCEAVPEAAPYRYAILDRDSIFGADVVALLKATGLRPNERAFRHRGKTEPPKDGSEAVVARSSIMSSR